MVVHAYYPIGEPRVQREAEALIDHGYEVDVICLRQAEEPARDLVYGVNVYRLPVRRHKGWGVIVQFMEYLAFFFSAFWRLTALHFRRRYDVVQVHNPPDFLVLAAMIPRLMGARIILDLHDLMPEFYASRFKSSMDSWPARLVRWQERLACWFANHVITVTEPWRQTLIRRGLSPDKCSVVMNVADSRIFRPDCGSFQPSWDNCFRLFYHGNLTDRYGVDIALHAVARLRDDLPDIRLTLHGRGGFLEHLQRLAEELELGDYVSFSTEYIPIEELPCLIACADLALVPYQSDVFTDGILPTKLMEYAALGVPAVVARTPAVEAYFDETMVQFFTPGDLEDVTRCIEELYQDRDRLAALAENIQRFNQQHNWTVEAARYVDLVDRLDRSTERQVKRPSSREGV
jgi:glycosyltransferase involved in cell wall biosynthesis